MKLSNAMRKALEVYADPQFTVEGGTIYYKQRYVGRIEERTWLAMRKRGYIADNSMQTGRPTDTITELGRTALGY